MKKSIFYFMFIIAFLFPFYASADDFTRKDLDLLKHNKYLQIENNKGIMKNSVNLDYSKLTSFPGVPGIPNYTLFVESTEKFKLVFWRELLGDGTSYIPFVRITPLTTNPTFICGPSFEIIASINLRQYGFSVPHLAMLDNVSLLAEDYRSFCDDIYEPKTFIWGQWSHEPQYDDSKAFVMIHTWDDNYIRIPGIDGSFKGLEEKTKTVVIPLP